MSLRIIRSRNFGKPDIYLLTVWTIVLAASLVGASMWTAGTPTTLLQPAEPAGEHGGSPYVGTIVTKPMRQNECVEYKFNNGTGVFTEARPIGCLDDAVLPSSHSQSADQLRFKSVKKAFGGAVH
jgi:hypothetical protein